MSHTDFLYFTTILGGFAGALFKKYCQDKVIDGFDWCVRHYIIRTERRLWIWLHHKLGHDSRNALNCEVGGCAKVDPVPKRKPVQYE
jgi:hypothetical protein